jgi:hypothetical protein
VHSESGPEPAAAILRRYVQIAAADSRERCGSL